MFHFCNWLLKKEQKVIFPKITYQRVGDDVFIPTKNSAIIHAKKHPEVLSVLGWKPDDIILLTPKGLKNEYVKAIEKICRFAVKNNISTKTGRGIGREELVVTIKGTSWLVVLEQQNRDLGTKKNSIYVPVGPMRTVTCYSKSKIHGYTTDPVLWLKREFLRLSTILYCETLQWVEEESERLMADYWLSIDLEYDEYELKSFHEHEILCSYKQSNWG